MTSKKPSLEKKYNKICAYIKNFEKENEFVKISYTPAQISTHNTASITLKSYTTLFSGTTLKALIKIIGKDLFYLTSDKESIMIRIFKKPMEK